MMKLSDNPWVSRYAPLLDRQIIKERATVVVPDIRGLRTMSTELACKKVENALETVFYPTNQCIDILHRFADAAFAHCATTYPDSHAFLRGIYSEKSPLSNFEVPILLTGLAGTGKSQLMKAFQRIQAAEKSVCIDTNHAPFDLKGPWNITVDARNSLKAMLSTLASSEGMTKDLIERCRKIAFRDGIALLHADEFQFATSSEKANALVTQMLLSLGLIGLPWVYNANYSLVRRIMKRPEEDLQRLASNYIVLLPEAPGSDDWINTLKAQRAVATELLTFDPKNDASDLHIYTAGRKRAMKQLIVQTIRRVHPTGGTIDIKALKRTYLSTDYAAYRNESEIILSQTIQNKPDSERPDLWCPLPIPKGLAVTFTEFATEQRNERLADAELKASLNKDERDGLNALLKTTSKANKSAGKVVPIRRNAPPTADELKQNANWIKDQF